MSNLDDLLAPLAEHLAALLGIAAIISGLWIADWLLLRRHRHSTSSDRFGSSLLMLLLTAVGIVLILLLLPISESSRSQLLGILGLLLSAVIGLASTTFVSNAMAGFMLRAVRSYRPGEFVQVGAEFGRVTERGLFHTEIQTEHGNLTTLPNLYLVSTPVTVYRSSGTIVAATVSLGYDVSRQRVEALLLEAAEAAGLEEGFVQVLELGDFSITYKVAGRLVEVKQLLTARSNLRKQMLDALHGGEVEIVSPTFMNQRRLESEERTLPPDAPGLIPPTRPGGPPEALIFDKADVAEQISALEGELGRLREAREAAETADRPRVDGEIQRVGERLAALRMLAEEGSGESEE